MSTFCNKYRVKVGCFVIFYILTLCGCKKLVEVDAPVTSTNARNVYANDETAISVLTAIYTQISDLNSDIANGSITGVSLFAGLSADEIALYNIDDPRLSSHYRNDLSFDTQSGNFWGSIYPIIFIANSAIEGLAEAHELTSTVRQQLIGEAKFARAFCYFYLVNLYGDVPLVLNTDYEKNIEIPRTPRSEVYRQIILDLIDAEGLLSSEFLHADLLTITTERVRPTKWAAAALLARVYLYNENYIDSEVEATKVIDNVSLFGLSVLDDVFLMNSTEAIWQLQPVHIDEQANTGEGALFVLPESGPDNFDYPVYLSNSVVNSFEQNDFRKENWVNMVIVDADTFYFPFKYKVGRVNAPVTEYIMMLRLAELYLIRSEARGMLNDIAGAQSDLNAVRSRAGLSGTTAGDAPTLKAAILHERRVELFCEWGHRWLDLKRTATIDAIMSDAAVMKGGTWEAYKSLYPIPQSEILRSLNLKQNVGY